MRKFVPSFLIFAGFYAYYAIQACPSFYFWDSAELTAAVLSNGVPHPPGFPLLLLLAKFWLKFTPVDDPAALGLFSAIFGAAGLSVWYLVIVRALNSIFPRTKLPAVGIISLISVIVMGLSLTYSIQATRFEVYSLNFFFFAVIFYLALRISESKHKSILIISMAIAVGLALGAHILTIALILPGLLLLVVPRHKSESFAFGGAVVIAGSITAALYLSIYFMAQKQPLLNWGDPSTWDRFFSYIFVREFDISASAFGISRLSDNFTFVGGLLFAQFGAIGILVGLMGLVYMFLRKFKMAAAISLILVFNIFSSVFAGDYFYENYDLHGYHTITLGLFALLITVSLYLFYNLIGKRVKDKVVRPDSSALFVTILVALLLFMVPVKNNIGSADLSDVDGREYASLFLKDIPSDAVILTSYYNTYFCLLAHEAAYGSDTDRIIQSIYNWDHRWGREQAAKMIRAEISLELDRKSFYRNYLNNIKDKRPIFIEYDESSGPIANYLIPTGLVYNFNPGDSLSINAAEIADEIESILAQASKSNQIEWLKTWVFWFSNRGLFFARIGDTRSAQAYFEAMNSLAAEADIK